MVPKEVTPTSLAQKFLTSYMAFFFPFLLLDTISQIPIFIGMKIQFQFKFQLGSIVIQHVFIVLGLVYM